MSCECTQTTERRFPSMLGCILRNSFSSKREVKYKKYLGGKEKLVKDTREVTVSIFFETPQDVEIFWNWYKEELQNGQLDFLIELPLFGVKKEHRVIFKPNFTESIFLGNTRELSTNLEILEFNDTLECQIC